MQHKCSRINFNHSRCLWWGQWELKAGKYHNFWRFIKLAITASLREGPFFLLLCWVTTFYLYAPLREHSCHSEYNVHCFKVFIDWFILLVSLVLKLFVSSRPLKLEGVLCIYVLLSMKDKLKTICMFFLIIWTHVWFSLFHFHDLLFVFIFML
jgi:hypothetical protein